MSTIKKNASSVAVVKNAGGLVVMYLTARDIDKGLDLAYMALDDLKVERI